MGNDEQLLQWVTALGREFRRRGMKGHVQALRVYFLALRRGLTTGGRRAVKVDFAEDGIVEWMKVLRVPPYQHAYDVRPPGSSCRKCPKRDGHPVDTATLLTFAGGAKMGCRVCGDAWLELERPVVASRAPPET